jgi:hypothetical protein
MSQDEKAFLPSNPATMHIVLALANEDFDEIAKSVVLLRDARLNVWLKLQTTRQPGT